MNLFATAMSLSMMAAVTPAGEERHAIRVSKAGGAASAAGPADYFTGTVRIDAPFQADAPARVGGATVTFEPGARTAWHTHPLGQTLIVTAGAGRVQEWGKPAQQIRPGDIVDSAGRQALARRQRDRGDVAHRHRRGAGWLAGDLAGAGQRGAVRGRVTRCSTMTWCGLPRHRR